MTLAPRPERDVPIVLGGRVKAAADRAGRLGDGFFPHLRDLDRLAELFDIARRAAEGAGRDPGALEIIAGGAKTPQDLERMQQIGVQHVIFSPRAKTLGELEGSIENYQQTVIQPVFG
jgi:alkanesulfonate monooxygenase SsuD/methylene tetrahydromethanopterin reductase-like flavin-dependent oxidoreductase (luciferase family)